jgi:hypothetical protein
MDFLRQPIAEKTALPLTFDLLRSLLTNPKKARA